MKQVITRLCILIVAMLVLLPNQSYAESEEVPLPSIQSESAILIDANTGAILFDKNSDKQMYPASITKIVTAILAIESGQLEDIVTVSKKAREVDGTRVYLEEGEEVSLKKLVQGLLINSGNDAGVAIAEHIDGSIEGFSTRMNDFVVNKLGLKDTHFENPHGLFSENHISTAYDFAMITKYALQNEVLTEIIGTDELEWIGEGWETTLYNHHWMLRDWPYEGIIGGKNGYIDQSGHTLVTAAERDGLRLIAVVLKANTKRMIYNDTEQLFDYGFENFETSTLAAPKKFKDENDDTYTLQEPLLYTKKINEEIHTEVNSSGKLEITGEGGQLLLEHTLEKPEKVQVAPLVTSEGQNEKKDRSIWLMLTIIPFLIIGFVVLKNIRKRKSVE
jgi:D-alanyl-D-alanine carboxypeptidase